MPDWSPFCEDPRGLRDLCGLLELWGLPDL